MRVRRATAQDLPRILEVERICFGRDAWNERLFRAYLASCPRLFLVATRAREVAGYAIACIRRNRGEIESIAIDPRSMRRGLGSTLLRSLFSALKRSGIRVVSLMVETRNAAAIAFYRRLGFRRTRTLPNYYGRGRHGWRMRLELES